MGRLPKRQRVAAYAVIIRGDRILLSRLAPRISRTPLWTLPGGGLDHGEDPREAVIREIHEETGLDAVVSEQARVYSLHNPKATHGERLADYHALRIVYDGWVPKDAPEPRVVEVDGSTVEAAWLPLADVLNASIPVTALVREALADHRPFERQRLAAYAVIRREQSLLLTRISALGHHAGSWTLPGGGVDHGEKPARALVREVAEECGLECVPGEVLDVHDVHFTGTAPSGRHEDFHGVHLIFAATVADGAVPRVVEVDGTTDEVAWVPIADIEAGRLEVLDVVRHALTR
ncbi:ADP-ribose pyrophosphatase YjhB (NUDIX family) [Nocardioides daedukensis]|uniref:ADP-ribose pyrophosphatase YjhB (NUDIX family) n=1 Tax=Nocardioides daedukensis TaxID=634462 RepID=A0A7Y9S0A1_9ACTN|nr:NUDIX domain-containing protein [Nocardioides daedukensis]NYG58786.1 ADP-ribose pyrophosphatase YjhB (NUDIX family) [Nocardioides daedukensis]